MPSELADKIAAEWKVVFPSPFGSSLYDTPDKTWGHTPEGSLRVSDHWNFRNKKYRNQLPKGQIVHCPTDRPPIEDGWTLARFENGVYVILEEWPRRLARSRREVVLHQPPKVAATGLASWAARLFGEPA
jgi:hypothetical protein